MSVPSWKADYAIRLFCLLIVVDQLIHEIGLLGLVGMARKKSAQQATTNIHY